MPVDITAFDILRLCAERGLEPADFVDAVPADKSDCCAFKAHGTLVKFQLRSFGRCTFFREKSKLKCTVHEHKPLMCQLYPHIPENGKLSVQKVAVCPARNLALAKKTTPACYEDFEWECKRYIGLVSEWNALSKGDKGPEKFFSYSLAQIKAEATPWGHVLRGMRRGVLRVLGRL